MACLAWAKLPDVTAFSMALPTELEPACSLLTSLHMALLGFDPLVLWFLAEAAVSGARASVRPSTPAQIPTHFDRCFTSRHLQIRLKRWTLQHLFWFLAAPEGPF